MPASGISKTASQTVVVALLLAMLGSWTSAWRTTRIRVLRTEDEKVRYLNSSAVLRENLFFGLRPILYVSRYSCDCAASDPGSGPASSNFDLPDFPAEDEVVPPDQPPRLSEPTSHIPTPAPAQLQTQQPDSGDESDQDDEEFELLISNSRAQQHVIEPAPGDFARPFVLAFRSKPVQRRARRRKVVRPRPLL